MEWKRRKVTLSIWECNGFKITEDVDGEDKPFRLDAPDSDPEWFSNIETAKAVAKLQNDYSLAMQDNARLREELAQARGVWPDEDDRNAQAAAAFEENMDADDCDDDGRGIPLPIRETVPA